MQHGGQKWMERHSKFSCCLTTMKGDGIYLKNTLNWVGLLNSEYVGNVDITFNNLVIVSLDIGDREIYTVVASS